MSTTTKYEFLEAIRSRYLTGSFRGGKFGYLPQNSAVLFPPDRWNGYPLYIFNKIHIF